MTLSRRSFLHRRSILLATAALAAMPLAAGAQSSYPAKPITLVVPLAAGGAADALGRIWADYARTKLGVAVVIDNRTGANGMIGAAYVAKQPADGYTLLMGTSTNMSLNAYAYATMPYRFSELDGVALLGTTSQVLVANPGAGIKSVDDLLRLARAKPGSISYGSAGKGNSTHLNVESLARHHKLELIHVPYKGAAPALLGVMGGETQFMCDAAGTAIAQSKAGKVVPFLVFGPQRIPAIPDVPTATELGIKDAINGGWYAVAAPAGTPKPIVEKLNAIANAMWADPESRAKLEAIYMVQLPDKDVGAVKRAADHASATWGPLITQLGIRNEN